MLRKHANKSKVVAQINKQSKKLDACLKTYDHRFINLQQDAAKSSFEKTEFVFITFQSALTCNFVHEVMFRKDGKRPKELEVLESYKKMQEKLQANITGKIRKSVDIGKELS